MCSSVGAWLSTSTWSPTDSLATNRRCGDALMRLSRSGWLYSSAYFYFPGPSIAGAQLLSQRRMEGTGNFPSAGPSAAVRESPTIGSDLCSLLQCPFSTVSIFSIIAVVQKESLHEPKFDRNTSNSKRRASGCFWAGVFSALLRALSRIAGMARTWRHARGFVCSWKRPMVELKY